MKGAKFIVYSFIFHMLVCYSKKREPHWYCRQEPKTIFRGLYRGNNFWNILASTEEHKWAAGKISTISGSLKNMTIYEAKGLTSKPQVKESVVVDKRSSTVAYCHSNQITVFSQTTFYFQHMQSLEEQFVFGGYMQTLLGCPPPYCMDATLDAADQVGDEVRFFRLGHYWNQPRAEMGDQEKTVSAHPIADEYTGIKSHIDAIMADDIGQYVYRESMLYFYLDMETDLDKIAEKCNCLSEDDKAWNKLYRKMKNRANIAKEQYIEIRLDDLPLNMTKITAATTITFNDVTHAIYFNETHYWILQLSSLWKMVMQLVSSTKCDLLQHNKLCNYETVYPARELTDFTLDLSKDGTNSVYKVEYQEETYYRFVDKWHHLNITQNNLAKALLASQISERFQPQLATDVFRCKDFHRTHFNMTGEEYTADMYQKMSPHSLMYLQMDTPVPPHANVLVIFGTLTLSFLVLVAGLKLLYMWAPRDKRDGNERTKTTTTTKTGTSTAKCSSDEEDEIWSPEEKGHNLAAELLEFIEPHK